MDAKRSGVRNEEGRRKGKARRKGGADQSKVWSLSTLTRLQEEQGEKDKSQGDQSVWTGKRQSRRSHRRYKEIERKPASSPLTVLTGALSLPSPVSQRKTIGAAVLLFSFSGSCLPKPCKRSLRSRAQKTQAGKD